MKNNIIHPPNELQNRLKRLGLYGVLAQWPECAESAWVPKLVEIEEHERQNRSLQYRLKNARIGNFKPMADFNWDWPKNIDRALIDELFTLQFLTEPANVILIGPNGVGKSMIAKNLAHQAAMAGHSVLFTSASAMLNELAAQDSGSSLRRRLKCYVKPTLLFVDEVGYLSYDNRHADLLFEVVTQRYQVRPTVITTNKSFEAWNDVFPNAACVVTLIDRLIHKAELIQIEGDSYRLKEAKERANDRARKRTNKRKAPQA